jgi:hypothetical protein
MAGGYHSRSPEEFRKYLSDLNSPSKTKNWRNVLLLVDLFLLLLVFYMVSKKLNPSLEITSKTSNKITIENLQLYAAKSSAHPPDTIGYFLFVANPTGKPVSFGKDRKLTIEVKTENNAKCLQKEVQLSEKNISPGISENYSFFFEKIPENELSEECKSVYKKPPFPRTIDTFFKKKYRVDTFMYIIENNGEKKELVLIDDNW